ncbi:protein SPO16 homolog [Bolinopsis microptera]|uniref:protein SPO16 homolog n=1 Tax=Bolinopsis microptera TaxID=2820187 RepID=UPI00307A2986
MQNSGAPVIVHCSLSNSDLTNRLQQKGHRIRYGTGTTEGSVIFPHGGPVFIAQQLTKSVQHWPPDSETALEPGLVTKLRKAQQVHTSLYLITVSPLLGLNELNVISLLQEMLPDMSILPVKDGRECADAMCNIVKVRDPDTRQIIEQRLETSVNDMRSNTYQDVLNSLPFEQADKVELSNRFKCVADLVKANKQDLQGIDNSQTLLDFFSEDKVTI